MHSGQGAAEFEMLVMDDSSAPGELTVTAISSNQLLVPDANIEISGTGELRTIRITPVEGNFGTTRITITATDSDGSSSTREFLFTVEETETQPRVLVELVPSLTVQGEVGERYHLQSSPKATGGEWTTLTTVTLTNAVQQVFVDVDAANAADRYYRAVKE